MANYLIIGGSGFIGRHLTKALLDDGKNVLVKTRNSTRTIKSFKKFGCSPKVIENFEQIDINDFPHYIISLAGAGIIDKRWTKARKKELINSRTHPLLELKNWLQGIDRLKKPKRILIGSAIGYYGYSKHPEITFHERSGFTKDFVHTICAETEALSDDLNAFSEHVISLRTGVVLSPNGGALKKMLLPAKLHLNGNIGDGKQWVSWVHLQDWINATRHILKRNDPKTVYNLTAPTPIRNEDFSDAIARKLNKKFQIGVPALLLKIILGEASILLTGSQKVKSKNLMEEGFAFKNDPIDKALDINQ